MVQFSIILCGLLLVFHTFSHLLLPPFLAAGQLNQYYQQKFRISQLDSAEFKISGLPKNIYWTINGTIFGTPSSFGEWKINIFYDSITESGNYQTILTIKDANPSSNPLKENANSINSLEMIFPENLIFQKGQQQIIEFQLKNGLQPINWKFTTLPKGVTQRNKQKLSVNIEKQGFYILRVQATDSLNNFIQACVTLNVQASKVTFSQTYAVDTIYQPSQSVNRLMEVSRKETEVARQINEAAKKLGQQNQTLKTNQQKFNRVSNNLIQLQNQAKIISQKIADTLKNKLIKEQKLKEALLIVQTAEDNLNLALIEQLSNNNLLRDSQVEKAKAQNTYNKTAKDLQNQLQVIKSIEKKLIQTQYDKQASLNLQTQKKARYVEVAQILIQKQREFAVISQQLARGQKSLMDSQRILSLQQQSLNQQETNYAAILNNINILDNKIKDFSRQIAQLNRQKIAKAEECQRLDDILAQIKSNDLFNLQEQIKYNEISIQTMLFQSIQQWNSIGYQSSLIKDYVDQVKFSGCFNSQYPTIEGVFTIQEGSSTDSYYQVQSGHKILFGKCTKMPKLKCGDTMIVKGFTVHGAIHADTIALF